MVHETISALMKCRNNWDDQLSKLFKPELGCLKDVELEVQFKSDFKPVFYKPRTVPFALLEDLN